MQQVHTLICLLYRLWSMILLHWYMEQHQACKTSLSINRQQFLYRPLGDLALPAEVKLSIKAVTSFTYRAFIHG